MWGVQAENQIKWTVLVVGKRILQCDEERIGFLSQIRLDVFCRQKN